LQNDVRALLALYEAAHLGTPKWTISKRFPKANYESPKNIGQTSWKATVR
jgi:hypothetical protein